MSTEKPVAKFKVGDPVIHYPPDVHFIGEVRWVDTRGWIYELQYSQVNMCSLTNWQGGGNSFWWDEKDLKEPVGEAKLLGELWRELREQRQLEARLKNSQINAEKLRYAIQLLRPPEPNK